MAVKTIFNPDDNYINHFITGYIDQGLMIEIFDNSNTLQGIRSDTAVIWEFDKVKIQSLTNLLENNRKIAQYIAEWQVENRKSYKVDLVAGSDLIYGMARMYQTISEFLPVTFKYSGSLRVQWTGLKRTFDLNSIR